MGIHVAQLAIVRTLSIATNILCNLGDQIDESCDSDSSFAIGPLLLLFYFSLLCLHVCISSYPTYVL